MNHFHQIKKQVADNLWKERLKRRSDWAAHLKMPQSNDINSLTVSDSMEKNLTTWVHNPCVTLHFVNRKISHFKVLFIISN